MTSSSPSVLRGSARSRQLDQALLPDGDGFVERMTVVVHDGEQFFAPVSFGLMLM